MTNFDRDCRTDTYQVHSIASTMSVDLDGVELAKLTENECRHSRDAEVTRLHHTTVPRRSSLVPDFLPFPLRGRLGSDTSRTCSYNSIEHWAAATTLRGSRSSSSKPSTRQGDVRIMSFLAPSSSKSPVSGEEFERSLSSVATNTSSASSEPLCRICYSDGVREELISPCQCSGSLAPIHKSCLEQWLSSSNTDYCDLCQYLFPVKRIPKSFCEFLFEDRHIWHPFLSDSCCMLILAPMICIATYLCITGAVEFLYREPDKAPLKILIKTNASVTSARNRPDYPNSFIWGTQVNRAKNEDSILKWEACGLLIIAGLLLIIFLLWVSMTARFYVRSWKDWRVNHYKIILLETIGQGVRYLGMPSPIPLSQQISGETNQVALTDNTAASFDNSSVTSMRSEELPSCPVIQCIQKNSTCGNSSTSKIAHKASKSACIEVVIKSASNQVCDCESYLETVLSGSGSGKEPSVGTSSVSPGSNCQHSFSLS